MRIAVCDDDNVMCEHISQLVKNAFEKQNVKVETVSHLNGITLLNEHLTDPFDIVFLDIDMPRMSGFDIAENLRRNFSQSFIVFITSHSELVYESLDYQPFHFIRKSCNIPLSESIPAIVEKLIIHMQISEKIILENEDERCVVRPDEIIYIKGAGHYLEYHILGKENFIRIRGTLKECETRYSKCHFVKIHKSYILNLKYLRTINLNDNDISLKIGVGRLPMGRLYKNSVEKSFRTYLRSK